MNGENSDLTWKDRRIDQDRLFPRVGERRLLVARNDDRNSPLPTKFVENLTKPSSLDRFPKAIKFDQTI